VNSFGPQEHPPTWRRASAHLILLSSTLDIGGSTVQPSADGQYDYRRQHNVSFFPWPPNIYTAVPIRKTQLVASTRDLNHTRDGFASVQARLPMIWTIFQIEQTADGNSFLSRIAGPCLGVFGHPLTACLVPMSAR
jgi:hypothetical protein